MTAPLPPGASRRRRSTAQHLADVLALVRPTPVVDLPLPDAAGTVLAADLTSLLDAPAFDASAMDGYAVRAADVTGAAGSTEVAGSAPALLRVVGDVPAGRAAPGPAGTMQAGTVRVGPGEAARIMTGAPLPTGADVVVPVEDTSTGRFDPGAPLDATVTVETYDGRSHVRRRAEDVARGDVVLAAGAVLTSRHLAVAASAGHASLAVHRPPLVAVLSTGSELVPAGQTPGPGMLPDSNSLLLAGAALEAGAQVVRRGAVGDTPAELAAALDDVLAVRGGTEDRPDLLVTTGGVSAGAFDVVRALLGSADAAVTDAHLVAVDMQPGKPQAIARWRGVPWVALPGSPVAAFVSFELFVRPAIDRLRGAAPRAAVTRVAGEAWTSPPGREQLVLVRDVAGTVVPLPRHRPSALALADAIAVVPAEVTAVAAGDVVRVLPLPEALPPRARVSP